MQKEQHTHIIIKRWRSRLEKAEEIKEKRHIHLVD